MTAPAFSAEPWLRVSVEVDRPILFGSAEGFERRCVPILGGAVTGRVAGRVLPGGSDWQRILADGTSELEAHYAILTDAGETIEVTSRGVRAGAPETMRSLLAGEAVDPALVYFRTAIRLHSASPPLAEVNRRLFVGAGVRQPTRVRIDIYAVE